MRKVNINRKTLFIIFCIVLISVFTLTLAYAALSTILTISGRSDVVASTWDVHFDNVMISSGGVSSADPVITSPTTVSFSTVLNMPGDFFEFTVDIVNDGTIDAMIDNITKTPDLTSEQSKYFEYIIEYENGDSININQLVSSKTFIRLKVKVAYKRDILVDDLPITSNILNLSFSINYVQSDSAGVVVPNNGSKFESTLSGDLDSIGTEICINSECFYVISSTPETVTMISKYNLYVGGEYKNSEWITYGDEATGIQDASMLGNKSGYTSKGVTIYSNTSSNYVGSLVESYIDNYRIYLISQGVMPIEARSLTVDEAFSFGFEKWANSSSDTPEWLYSTSYWLGSAINSLDVWGINSNSILSNGNYYTCNTVYGVRPVITISKSYL